MQKDDAATDEKQDKKNGLKARTNINAGETAVEQCKRSCTSSAPYRYRQDCYDWCKHPDGQS